MSLLVDPAQSGYPSVVDSLDTLTQHPLSNARIPFPRSSDSAWRSKTSVAKRMEAKLGGLKGAIERPSKRHKGH